MKGLDIAREFYLQYGLPMLEEHFPDILGRVSIGLVGEGSECLGFDDEISRDHDFEPGFCIWIDKCDEEKYGFPLERAYAKLPREFMGLKRRHLSPVGGNRHGVISSDAFYIRHLGAPTAPDSFERWLYTPPASLCTASNGELFYNGGSHFSEVRDALLRGYPLDIRKKKLAAHAVFMAQSGQYNYPRCLKRGETGAGQLAIFEFVRNAISAIFLLNNKYEPFYKWAYRAMRDLPVLGHIGDSLAALTELDNASENARVKLEVIEDIAALFIKEFEKQGFSDKSSKELEVHAYSIQNSISDTNLRNMHIMSGV